MELSDGGIIIENNNWLYLYFRNKELKKTISNGIFR